MKRKPTPAKPPPKKNCNIITLETMLMLSEGLELPRQGQGSDIRGATLYNCVILNPPILVRPSHSPMLEIFTQGPPTTIVLVLKVSSIHEYLWTSKMI